MHWLAKEDDRRQTTMIKRFDPLYWTVNFPRPMMASVVNTATDALTVNLVFYRHDDLAGLIWETVDHYDHPLLGYETRRDYSGVTFSFRWQASGVRALDVIHGPTLTIEGRDHSGMPRSWYVRLWNYAVGDGDDAVITLRFDQLSGGYLLPSEADPVYVKDIDRLFISLVPLDYNPDTATPLSVPQNAVVTISEMTVSGGGSSLARGDIWMRPHGLGIANGYDDTFNLVPERIIRNVVQLGYRTWIDHYVGMSHYFRLAWHAGDMRFVVNPAAPTINTATIAWHQAFFAAAKRYRFIVIVSLSFELFDDHAPEDWKQRTHNGTAAQTGWSPPSTLIAPTHADGLAYLKTVFLAFLSLQEDAGLPCHAQIGEPWWWHQIADDDAPCFYDDTTTALYTTETGLPVPDVHESIFETPTADQSAYLDWLGAKLGAATHYLRDSIRADYADAVLSLLFFTPQVLNPAAPMMQVVNMPVAAWAYPAFDVLELEDYDHVIDGDWDAHEAGLDAAVAALGYDLSVTRYFAGFVLLPDNPVIWRHIDRALGLARSRGFSANLVWAYSQVMRDGFVYSADQGDGVTGFHNVRFPEAISYGSSGGPRFATTITETVSGYEQRNMEWAEARADYEVGSGLKSEEDLAVLLAFFRARKGRAYGFRFKDWSDYRSSVSGGAVSPFDQTIGIGTGGQASFQLIKRYSSGGIDHVRVISKPVLGSVRVALNGAEVLSGWSVNDETGALSFSSAPGSGVEVSVGFEFDVPVRFGDDKLDLSLQTFAAGEIPHITLTEIRL